MVRRRRWLEKPEPRKIVCMIEKGVRRKGFQRALGLAGYAWAAPYSALGLVFGLMAVLFGARMRVRRGALEVGGGWLGAAAARRCSYTAMTLGHVILGIDEATLDRVRAHEQVHVRQYERWGPLFLPAYFLSSLLQFARGKRPYRDNHFERQAYAQTADGATQGERPTRARQRT